MYSPPRDIHIPKSNVYIPALDDDISGNEVEEQIKLLKANKAAGVDGIPPGILKYITPQWILMITALFNQIFQSAVYPVNWSIAKFSVIHKKGPKSDTNNYRGISILSSLYKVYEGILNSRLNRWFRPDIEQAGAQKGRGCAEQLVTLRLLIDVARHTKQQLFVLFIDFEKAYDKVPRQKLLDMLKSMGCGHRMIRAVGATLLHTLSRLNSTMFRSSTGVRQGGSSSCFLFTLFINPLIRALKEFGQDGFLQQTHTLMLME